jgi:hypothetical protein
MREELVANYLSQLSRMVWCNGGAVEPEYKSPPPSRRLINRTIRATPPLTAQLSPKSYEKTPLEDVQEE